MSGVVVVLVLWTIAILVLARMFPQNRSEARNQSRLNHPSRLLVPTPAYDLAEHDVHVPVGATVHARIAFADVLSGGVELDCTLSDSLDLIDHELPSGHPFSLYLSSLRNPKLGRTTERLLRGWANEEREVELYFSEVDGEPCVSFTTGDATLQLELDRAVA